MDRDNLGHLAPFSAAGGRFLIPAEEMADAVARVRAVVFDWDGVFNAGAKGSGSASGFSEADSMGVNMLRFGLWRSNGQLPAAAIVTGEENPAAVQFGEREHFQAIYLGVADKRSALRHLCQSEAIDPKQVALVFDDINDLGMAEECGVRCMVRRDGSPLLHQYAGEHGLCDYVTAATPGSHAVREVAELMLGQLGVYDDVVRSRVDMDAAYQEYFSARQRCVTVRLHVEGGRIIPLDL